MIITCNVGYDCGVALAPLAVAPEHQRTGVGTDLVRHGIAALRGRRYGVLVVLGPPAFYRRFGFKPASAFNLRCEFPAPPESFMALSLDRDWVPGSGGVVRYAPPFSEF